jgi:alkyl hydroperoxide reductase subunit AhpF
MPDKTIRLNRHDNLILIISIDGAERLNKTLHVSTQADVKVLQVPGGEEYLHKSKGREFR